MIVLFECLGFSANTSGMLVDVQNIEDLSEISLLADEGVESLCKLIRRPGESILNPNANATGQSAEIPAPGQAVIMCIVISVKLVAYFVCYCNRTHRIYVPGSVTLARVHELRSSYNEDMEYVPPQRAGTRLSSTPRTGARTSSLLFCGSRGTWK